MSTIEGTRLKFKGAAVHSYAAIANAMTVCSAAKPLGELLELPCAYGCVMGATMTTRAGVAFATSNCALHFYLRDGFVWWARAAIVAYSQTLITHHHHHRWC